MSLSLRDYGIPNVPFSEGIWDPYNVPFSEGLFEPLSEGITQMSLLMGECGNITSFKRVVSIEVYSFYYLYTVTAASGSWVLGLLIWIF